MNFWSLLKLLWANRDLIRWLVGLIQAGVTAIQIRERLKEFDKAAEKAKDEKDTSDLDDLFGNPNRK
jgi:thiamine monophosphate synthase